MTKIKTLENKVAAAALELAAEYKRNGCKYEFAGEDDYPDDVSVWGNIFGGVFCDCGPADRLVVLHIIESFTKRNEAQKRAKA